MAFAAADLVVDNMLVGMDMGIAERVGVVFGFVEVEVELGACCHAIVNGIFDPKDAPTTCWWTYQLTKAQQVMHRMKYQ